MPDVQAENITVADAALISGKGFLPVGSKDSGVAYKAVDPTKLAEREPYPGVDYLGFGYDLIHGNPHGDGR